ncbi:MAG: Ig-like domain-containing protein [Patescibacteria group bacterium]
MLMKRFLSASLALASILFWIANPAVLAASPVIKAITLSPGVATVQAGQTQVFTLKATIDDGTTAEVSDQAVWTLPGGGFTGIPGQRGLFTAVSQGSWTLTTTIAGLSATAAITVTHGTPTSLNVLPTSAALTADGILPLRIYGVDGQGNGFDLHQEVTLSTTDPKGTVTADGYTPSVAGTWMVTATLGALSDSVPVTITPGMLKKLTVTPNELTTDPGDTTELTVSGTDAKGNVITPKATVRVSNPDVATVNENGKILAKSTGQTNIIVEADGVTTAVPFIVQGEAATTQTDDVVAVAKPTPVARTPQVAAEEIDRTPETESQPEVLLSTETKTTEACKNLAHPWAIILLILHVILLSVFFSLLQRVNRFPWWWAPPVALTAAMLGVYVGTFCKETYLWWPWSIIGITVIFLSVYYQNLEPPTHSPPEQQPPPKM